MSYQPPPYGQGGSYQPQQGQYPGQPPFYGQPQQKPPHQQQPPPPGGSYGYPPQNSGSFFMPQQQGGGGFPGSSFPPAQQGGNFPPQSSFGPPPQHQQQPAPPAAPGGGPFGGMPVGSGGADFFSSSALMLQSAPPPAQSGPSQPMSNVNSATKMGAPADFFSSVAATPPIGAAPGGPFSNTPSNSSAVSAPPTSGGGSGVVFAASLFGSSNAPPGQESFFGSGQGSSGPAQPGPFGSSPGASGPPPSTFGPGSGQAPSGSGPGFGSPSRGPAASVSGTTLAPAAALFANTPGPSVSLFDAGSPFASGGRPASPAAAPSTPLGKTSQQQQHQPPPAQGPPSSQGPPPVQPAQRPPPSQPQPTMQQTQGPPPSNLQGPPPMQPPQGPPPAQGPPPTQFAQGPPASTFQPPPPTQQPGPPTQGPPSTQWPPHTPPTQGPPPTAFSSGPPPSGTATGPHTPHQSQTRLLPGSQGPPPPHTPTPQAGTSSFSQAGVPGMFQNQPATGGSTPQKQSFSAMMPPASAFQPQPAPASSNQPPPAAALFGGSPGGAPPANTASSLFGPPTSTSPFSNNQPGIFGGQGGSYPGSNQSSFTGMRAEQKPPTQPSGPPPPTQDPVAQLTASFSKMQAVPLQGPPPSTQAPAVPMQNPSQPPPTQPGSSTFQQPPGPSMGPPQPPLSQAPPPPQPQQQQGPPPSVGDFGPGSHNQPPPLNSQSFASAVSLFGPPPPGGPVGPFGSVDGATSVFDQIAKSDGPSGGAQQQAGPPPPVMGIGSMPQLPQMSSNFAPPQMGHSNQFPQGPAPPTNEQGFQTFNQSSKPGQDAPPAPAQTQNDQYYQGQNYQLGQFPAPPPNQMPGASPYGPPPTAQISQQMGQGPPGMQQYPYGGAPQSSMMEGDDEDDGGLQWGGANNISGGDSQLFGTVLTDTTTSTTEFEEASLVPPNAMSQQQYQSAPQPPPHAQFHQPQQQAPWQQGSHSPVPTQQYPNYLGMAQPNTAYGQHSPQTGYMHRRGDAMMDRPAFPFVAFGFGGRIVKVFPEPGTYGRMTSTVKITSLGTVLKDTPTYQELTRFPGPLATNANRKTVAAHVTERSKEAPGDTVLWDLLGVMLKHDGLPKPNNEAGNKEIVDIVLNTEEEAFANDYNRAMRCGHPLLEAEKAATLTEVKRLLLRGSKKEAVDVAMKGRLWEYALALASYIDASTFHEVVAAMASQDLVPSNPLAAILLRLAGKQPEIDINEWRENLAMLLSNRTRGDGPAIIKLGEQLAAAQQKECAHFCFLVGGEPLRPFHPQARMVLIGGDHISSPRCFASNDAIQRTEIYEYALALGNSQYSLPALQPWKLVYALRLADMGRTKDALNYCNNIISTVKNSSGQGAQGIYTRFFFEQLQAFNDRLRVFDPDAGTTATGKWWGMVVGGFEKTLSALVSTDEGKDPPKQDPLAPSNFAPAHQSGHQRYPSQPQVMSPSDTSMPGAKPMFYNPAAIGVKKAASSADLQGFGASQGASQHSFSTSIGGPQQPLYSTTPDLSSFGYNPPGFASQPPSMPQQSPYGSEYPGQGGAPAPQVSQAPPQMSNGMGSMGGSRTLDPVSETGKQSHHTRASSDGGAGWLSSLKSWLPKKEAEADPWAQKNTIVWDEAKKQWVDMANPDGEEESPQVNVPPVVGPPPTHIPFQGYGPPPSMGQQMGGVPPMPPQMMGGDIAQGGQPPFMMPPAGGMSPQGSAGKKVRGTRSRYVDPFSQQ